MVASKLKSFFTRSKSKELPDKFESPLAPEDTFYAVGDVHGCNDLLDSLLNRIKRDKAERKLEKAPVVFLGDYIDRGSSGAQVLSTLRRMQQEDPEGVICLQGNHEKMMLDFLEDPLGKGARWARFGGVETLKSFGISSVSENSNPEDLFDACDALDKAMPAGLRSWVSELPLIWRTGNAICVHAALDPDRAVSQQSKNVLLWGHPEFSEKQRNDGNWVIHGHTIVPKPQINGGRISIDTGAYKTGRLSAAVIGNCGCQFLQ